MSAVRQHRADSFDSAPTRVIARGAVREQRRATAQPLHTTTYASPAPRQAARQQAAPERRPLFAGLPDMNQVVTTMLLIGALAVILYFGITSLLAWTQIKMDDFKYGRPRTSQIDAFVGHGEATGVPTHFVAMNLNRRVTIMEFPGGDVTKPVVLVGPTLFGRDQDLTVVRLQVEDINGDDKPDLTVQVKDERLVYLNDGNVFRPITADELARIKQQGGR